MQNLTIQILTYNNSETIKRCLDSLAHLDANIIIGDLGSTDGTTALAKCIPITWTKDFSQIRNQLIAPGYNMWIEPWEVIDGDIELDNAKFYVQQDNVLTREVRLWKDAQFTRPVYEYLDISATQQNVFIYSQGSNRSDLNKEALTHWRATNPAAGEIDYYEACNLLTEKKYKEFMTLSNKYLFRETDPKEATNALIRYYQALVNYHVFKDMNSAIRCLLPALMMYPLMAEFWCLLGDCFKSQKYRSIKFYENAIALGKKRKEDELPIDISKYKEYPERMING